MSLRGERMRHRWITYAKSVVWFAVALACAVFVAIAAIGWAVLAGFLASSVGLDYAWVATIAVVSGFLGVFPTMKFISWIYARTRRAPTPSAEEVADIFT
jgi:hypothetical protein